MGRYAFVGLKAWWAGLNGRGTRLASSDEGAETPLLT